MYPRSEVAEAKAASRPAARGGWASWDEFLEATPATGFMQTSWWSEFRVEAGFDHFGAVLRHQGEILGGAVVQKYWWDDGMCFYYIPDGPVLPDNPQVARQVLETVLGAIDKRRASEEETVSHLRMEPRWEKLPEPLENWRRVPAFEDPYMEPRDTLCVDLRPSEEAILAQMKPKGRYNIRLARRRGVEIVEDNSDEGVEDFFAIYEEMSERQGLNPKPFDYFESLVSYLSTNGKGSLLFAEYGGRRIATAIVVYFGGRATYFFGGSTGEHRNVMAPYLIHFEAMRKAKEMGCECYDFWGIAPTGASEHPWKDITAFKRKFGGHEVNLVPTLDHVYDESAYAIYLG